MALVGAVYQIDPYPRTPHEVVEALFHDPALAADDRPTRRPAPQHKRLQASLNRQEGTTPVHAADFIITKSICTTISTWRPVIPSPRA